jgi:heat shock protein HslJ
MDKYSVKEKLLKKFVVISVIAGMIIAGVIAGLMALSRSADAESPETPLEATSWTLVSWNDPLGLPQTPITLQVADGAISGVAACNNYWGPMNLTGETIEIDPLAVTQMFCMDSADAEVVYLSLLQGERTWSMDGDYLVIAADGVELLRFEPTL